MSEQTFKTLSILVKNNIIRTVQVPEIQETIEKLTQESDLLTAAGFSLQAHERIRNQHRIEKEWLLQNELKYWREKGYLVIKIKNFKSWNWKHRINDQCWAKKIQEKTEVTTKTFLFGEKTSVSWECNKVLALINTNQYLATVPIHVLERAAEFRQEALQQRGDNYPGIQTYVLTVTTPQLLRSIVSQIPNDPLLLYRPQYDGDYNSHLGLGGNFVVISWWGADIEEIEASLELDRSEFPATSIFTSETRSTEVEE